MQIFSKWLRIFISNMGEKVSSAFQLSKKPYNWLGGLGTSINDTPFSQRVQIQTEPSDLSTSNCSNFAVNRLFGILRQPLCSFNIGASIGGWAERRACIPELMGVGDKSKMIFSCLWTNRAVVAQFYLF